MLPNGSCYLRVGGRGFYLGAEKLEARKLLAVGAADFHIICARFVRRHFVHSVYPISLNRGSFIWLNNLLTQNLLHCHSFCELIN